MPAESNYFEEASRLFHDRDPIVAQISVALYEKMLAAFQNEKLEPASGFNIHYFLNTAIRAWFLSRKCQPLPATLATDVNSQILAMNWPAVDATWDSKPVVKQFLELVQSDAQPEGDAFDVAYAVTILLSSFTADGKLRLPLPSSMEPSEEFDYWLSGFNSPGDNDVREIRGGGSL